MPNLGANLMVIVTILFTALCWGSYGPLLQWGHGDMGSGRLRPFICVGIAYFFVAIVGPLVLMMMFGNETSDKSLWQGWTFTGILWSLAGGAAGALGAFGIILALNYGGSPTFVMPMVFGIAPVINTFIMMTVNRKWHEFSQNPFFAAGLILVAVGAVTVLLSAPRVKPHAKPQAKASAKLEKVPEKKMEKKPAKADDVEQESVPRGPAVDPPQENS